ncbi:hypothetical protein DRH29_02925 [candidate division Kazan bacterium]|uniref:HTH tetR-type domain-containing protein n=1 Tax=candidate division Kazan bacterium TaxID=2202143 RepID=A0A420ZCI9_UNCK3|nr:MAG: hypothetical protein DRH29_02925 [candidate division Kazan bacterium]
MQDEDTRGKHASILTAAGKLFAQFGNKASMDEIARFARVAKKTIYNHFKSKEDLFEAVVRRESDTLVELIRLAVSRESTARRKLRVYMLTKIGKMKELSNFYNVTREAAIEFWPQVEGIRENYLKMEKNIVLDILRQGIINNEISVPEPELTAQTIVIAVKGMEARWIMKSSNYPEDKTIEKLLDILFYGISKRQANH